MARFRPDDGNIHLLGLSYATVAGRTFHVPQGQAWEIIYERESYENIGQRNHNLNARPDPRWSHVTEPFGMNTSFLPGFGAALAIAGLVPTASNQAQSRQPWSQYNPNSRKQNCVSVTLAKLLGFGSCNDMWRACNIWPHVDSGLDLQQIYNLLRKTRTNIVFQHNPPLDKLDDFCHYVDAAFNAAAVGLCYMRPYGQGGHCVVYHKPEPRNYSPLHQRVAPEMKGRIRCYQRQTRGEDLTDDVKSSRIVLAFICLRSSDGGGFESYDSALMERARRRHQIAQQDDWEDSNGVHDDDTQLEEDFSPTMHSYRHASDSGSRCLVQ